MVLDPKYLSQIKSDLIKISRATSCVGPMIIKPLQIRIPPLLLPFSPSPPPSNHSIFFSFLNISAKSNRIFTKFSGYIPVDVPR